MRKIVDLVPIAGADERPWNTSIHAHAVRAPAFFTRTITVGAPPGPVQPAALIQFTAKSGFCGTVFDSQLRTDGRPSPPGPNVAMPYGSQWLRSPITKPVELWSSIGPPESPPSM